MIYYCTAETCQYLVVSEPVVERVVAIFGESSLSHIKIEASRLTASLVKNGASNGDHILRINVYSSSSVVVYYY